MQARGASRIALFLTSYARRYLEWSSVGRLFEAQSCLSLNHITFKISLHSLPIDRELFSIIRCKNYRS